MNRLHFGFRTTVILTIIAISAPLFLLLASDEEAVEDLDLNLSDLFNLKVSIASKTEESIFNAPGVVTIVTQDELQRFGGTTLADIIRRVPSITGATSCSTDRSIIASRGDFVSNTSHHILILLNGRPMREILEAGVNSEVLESFPVNIIEHIEIIRGPGSVLYGSQAFSGVINIITKRTEENTVSLSGAVGEGLRNNIMADLQYQIGDFSVILAGR